MLSPLVSVVVPSRGGANRLPILMEALAGQEIDEEWEVVVVLDGDIDDSRRVVEMYADRLPLRLITRDASTGVAGALSDGYAAAQGDIVIRCDDDLTPRADFVARHLAWHRQRPPNAPPLGVIALTRDSFADSPYANAYGRHSNERALAQAYARPAEARWMHWAACNSVPKAAYEAVGGFDLLMTFREDSELGRRLAMSGVEIVIDPALEIEHRAPSLNTEARASRAFTSGASTREFERRHPSSISALDRHTLWTRMISLTADRLRSRERAAGAGRQVDRLLPYLPASAGRKLVAFVVETSGAAGRNATTVEWIRPLDPRHPTTSERVGAQNRRIAVLSTTIAYPGVPHAGGNYLLALDKAWAKNGLDYTYFVPAYPTNEAASAAGDAPPHRIMGARDTRAGRAMRRLTDQWRRLDPSAPDLEFAWAIVRDPSTRRMIADADIIDLQWMEAIRLQRLVRALNPRALVVGTFHDVLSQRFTRAAERASSRRHRFKWRMGVWFAKRAERTAGRTLDRCVFFADKDALLLETPATTSILRPPMAASDAAPHSPVTPAQVVFVAYLAREENLDALRWLAQSIWPAVAAAHPEARLRIIGKGPTDQLRVELSNCPGLEIVGFVSELGPEYAAATACIVPLRLGAGVKFKVIEAMSAGVPVVSTSVGAEGIGEGHRFVLISDDPSALSSALIATLNDPKTSSVRAQESRTWAIDTFGFDRFVESVAKTYAVVDGLELSALPGAPNAPHRLA